MRQLTLEIAEWLTTPVAADALTWVATLPLDERSVMTTLATIQKQYPADRAAALLDQARLRRRATVKFGDAAHTMLFTDEALQQATGRAIATYRAQRFADFAAVADLGCGIGGDALALSTVAPTLLAIDHDAIRLLLARHNLTVAGGSATVTFIQSDWTTYAFPSEVQAAFADPARRVEGVRRFSLHALVPPLSAWQGIRTALPHLAMKVMPGVPDEEIPVDCDVEWISEEGEAKEAILWFGDLRRGITRGATVIRNGVAHPFPLSNAVTLPLSAPRSYLYEPDPALIRASLVEPLGAQLNAAQIDPLIAYLTADAVHDTPFARAWQVLDHFPFNLKKLNEQLRHHDANVLAIKKRGSPIEPETFRKRLKSNPRGQPVTIFVTRYADQPWVILCGDELRAPSRF